MGYFEQRVRLLLGRVFGWDKENCTQNKADGDEKKIEKGTIDFIEYTNTEKGHFIRFNGKLFVL